MTEPATFLGYTVEKLADDGSRSYRLAYVLTGPRGATYGLVRNANRPHMMFAVRGSTGFVCDIKGNSWFSDKDGYLATCN